MFVGEILFVKDHGWRPENRSPPHPTGRQGAGRRSAFMGGGMKQQGGSEVQHGEK